MEVITEPTTGTTLYGKAITIRIGFAVITILIAGTGTVITATITI